MPVSFGYENSYGVNCQPETSDKRRTVALILCLFGGFSGWHYLYVGKFWRAVLCLFTLNFLGIGYIIDIYRITRYKFNDGEGLRLSK